MVILSAVYAIINDKQDNKYHLQYHQHLCRFQILRKVYEVECLHGKSKYNKYRLSCQKSLVKNTEKSVPSFLNCCRIKI